MRCRARYKVQHQEWRCRKCATLHLGTLAASPRCTHCGKRRHFSNKAPAVLPAVAAAFAIFGVILVVGGAMTRHGPKAEEKPLIDVSEISLSNPLEAPIVPPGPDGKVILDIPASVTITYTRTPVDFPVIMHPTQSVVSFVDRKAKYSRAIGYTEVPGFKMRPGDVVHVSMVVHMELGTLDFWGRHVNTFVLGGKPFVQRTGPMTIAYEIQPNDTPFGKFASWLIGDSDLTQRYTYMCEALLDPASDALPADERPPKDENCTAMPELGNPAIERVTDTAPAPRRDGRNAGADRHLGSSGSSTWPGP